MNTVVAHLRRTSSTAPSCLMFVPRINSGGSPAHAGSIRGATMTCPIKSALQDAGNGTPSARYACNLIADSANESIYGHWGQHCKRASLG